MPEYIPVITAAGMAAALAAETGGFQVNITHVALGETGYMVAVNGSGLAIATQLVTERDRVAIQHAREIVPGQTDISFVVSSGNEYFVREVGFFLADGTLFAIASSPTTALMWKSALTQAAIAFELVLEAVNPAFVTIISTGPPLELLLTAERARLTALENAGLGVESATLVTDFNAVTKGGSYRALVPANAPTADSGWTLRHEAGQNNTEAVQFATLMATQMSYMRQKSGGVWAPWRETWHAGNAPGNFGLNGYQKLPSGLIVQWGNGTTSASAGVTVTFPIAFPSSHMTINAILAGTSGPICWSVGTLANPKTGFMMHAFTAAGARLATTFTYLVIGY